MSFSDIELDKSLIKDPLTIYKHSPQIPYLKKLKKDFQKFYGKRSEFFILEVDITTERGRSLLQMIRNVVKNHNNGSRNKKMVNLEGTTPINPTKIIRKKDGTLKEQFRDEWGHVEGGMENWKRVAIYVYDDLQQCKRQKR